jgi:leader peptidase (prepilin peptidase)/N-methyltransferase
MFQTKRKAMLPAYKFVSSGIPIYLIFVLLGLAIGSFLNVVIYRLPIILREVSGQTEIASMPHWLNILRTLCLPRSFCLHCRCSIPFWANIPLFGFAILHGRCYQCAGKISWRYPLIELISAVATVFLLIRFGLTEKCLASLVFTWILLTLASIDYDSYLLPDELTLSLLWLGLLCSLWHVFISSEDAVLGAVCGYLSLWLIAQIFRLIRGIEGIGYGDFKLAAALGAWIGWQAVF